MRQVDWENPLERAGVEFLDAEFDLLKSGSTAG